MAQVAAEQRLRQAAQQTSAAIEGGQEVRQAFAQASGQNLVHARQINAQLMDDLTDEELPYLAHAIINGAQINPEKYRQNIRHTWMMNPPQAVDAEYATVAHAVRQSLHNARAMTNDQLQDAANADDAELLHLQNTKLAMEGQDPELRDQYVLDVLAEDPVDTFGTTQGSMASAAGATTFNNATRLTTDIVNFILARNTNAGTADPMAETTDLLTNVGYSPFSGQEGATIVEQFGQQATANYTQSMLGHLNVNDNRPKQKLAKALQAVQRACLENPDATDGRMTGAMLDQLMSVIDVKMSLVTSVRNLNEIIGNIEAYVTKMRRRGLDTPLTTFNPKSQVSRLYHSLKLLRTRLDLASQYVQGFRGQDHLSQLLNNAAVRSREVARYIMDNLGSNLALQFNNDRRNSFVNLMNSVMRRRTNSQRNNKETSSSNKFISDFYDNFIEAQIQQMGSPDFHPLLNAMNINSLNALLPQNLGINFAQSLAAGGDPTSSVHRIYQGHTAAFGANYGAGIDPAVIATRLTDFQFTASSFWAVFGSSVKRMVAFTGSYLSRLPLMLSMRTMTETGQSYQPFNIQNFVNRNRVLSTMQFENRMQQIRALRQEHQATKDELIKFSVIQDLLRVNTIEQIRNENVKGPAAIMQTIILPALQRHSNNITGGLRANQLDGNAQRAIYDLLTPILQNMNAEDIRLEGNFTRALNAAQLRERQLSEQIERMQRAAADQAMAMNAPPEEQDNAAVEVLRQNLAEVEAARDRLQEEKAALLDGKERIIEQFREKIRQLNMAMLDQDNVQADPSALSRRIAVILNERDTLDELIRTVEDQVNREITVGIETIRKGAAQVEALEKQRAGEQLLENEALRKRGVEQIAKVRELTETRNNAIAELEANRKELQELRQAHRTIQSEAAALNLRIEAMTKERDDRNLQSTQQGADNERRLKEAQDNTNRVQAEADRLVNERDQRIVQISADFEAQAKAAQEANRRMEVLNQEYQKNKSEQAAILVELQQRRLLLEQRVPELENEVRQMKEAMLAIQEERDHIRGQLQQHQHNASLVEQPYEEEEQQVEEVQQQQQQQPIQIQQQEEEIDIGDAFAFGNQNQQPTPFTPLQGENAPSELYEPLIDKGRESSKNARAALSKAARQRRKEIIQSTREKKNKALEKMRGLSETDKELQQKQSELQQAIEAKASLIQQAVDASYNIEQAQEQLENSLNPNAASTASNPIEQVTMTIASPQTFNSTPASVENNMVLSFRGPGTKGVLAPQVLFAPHNKPISELNDFRPGDDDDDDERTKTATETPEVPPEMIPKLQLMVERRHERDRDRDPPTVPTPRTFENATVPELLQSTTTTTANIANIQSQMTDLAHGAEIIHPDPAVETVTAQNIIVVPDKETMNQQVQEEFARLEQDTANLKRKLGRKVKELEKASNTLNPDASNVNVDNRLIIEELEAASTETSVPGVANPAALNLSLNSIVQQTATSLNQADNQLNLNKAMEYDLETTKNTLVIQALASDNPDPEMDDSMPPAQQQQQQQEETPPSLEKSNVTHFGRHVTDDGEYDVNLNILDENDDDDDDGDDLLSSEDSSPHLFQEDIEMGSASKGIKERGFSMGPGLADIVGRSQQILERRGRDPVTSKDPMKNFDIEVMKHHNLAAMYSIIVPRDPVLMAVTQDTVAHAQYPMRFKSNDLYTNKDSLDVSSKHPERLAIDRRFGKEIETTGEAVLKKHPDNLEERALNQAILSRGQISNYFHKETHLHATKSALDSMETGAGVRYHAVIHSRIYGDCISFHMRPNQQIAAEVYGSDGGPQLSLENATRGSMVDVLRIAFTRNGNIGATATKFQYLIQSTLKHSEKLGLRYNASIELNVDNMLEHVSYEYVSHVDQLVAQIMADSYEKSRPLTQDQKELIWARQYLDKSIYMLATSAKAQLMTRMKLQLVGVKQGFDATRVTSITAEEMAKMREEVQQLNAFLEVYRAKYMTMAEMMYADEKLDRAFHSKTPDAEARLIQSNTRLAMVQHFNHVIIKGAIADALHRSVAAHIEAIEERKIFFDEIGGALGRYSQGRHLKFAAWDEINKLEQAFFQQVRVSKDHDPDMFFTHVNRCVSFLWKIHNIDTLGNLNIHFMNSIDDHETQATRIRDVAFRRLENLVTAYIQFDLLMYARHQGIYSNYGLLSGQSPEMSVNRLKNSHYLWEVHHAREICELGIFGKYNLRARMATRAEKRIKQAMELQHSAMVIPFTNHEQGLGASERSTSAGGLEDDSSGLGQAMRARRERRERLAVDGYNFQLSSLPLAGSSHSALAFLCDTIVNPALEAIPLQNRDQFFTELDRLRAPIRTVFSDKGITETKYRQMTVPNTGRVYLFPHTQKERLAEMGISPDEEAEFQRIRAGFIPPHMRPSRAVTKEDLAPVPTMAPRPRINPAFVSTVNTEASSTRPKPTATSTSKASPKTTSSIGSGKPTTTTTTTSAKTTTATSKEASKKKSTTTTTTKK